MYNRNLLFKYVMSLAKDANGFINSQKVNKIKKILLVSGGIILGIGVIMLALSTIGFVTQKRTEGYNILIIIGVLVAIAGGTLLSLGITLAISGYGAKVLDKSVKCPNCETTIGENELYCPNCGSSVRADRVCKNCSAINELGDSFCRKCGNKLD